MNFMTEATEPVHLIDSNILIYGYDNTDPHKHKIAQKLLEQCWKKTSTFAISSQNLAEFFVIVTKKIPHPLPLEEAEQIIADIIHFPNWQVLNYDEQTLLKAIGLHKKERKHFWDAVIVATMLQNSVFHIYTENAKDFSGYESINAVNPFGI